MNTKIGKVTLVAEIGTGHGGDLNKARDLINAAREAGADYAKFQIVYADEILHPNTGFVDLPSGKLRLYDRFRELEMPPAFFRQIQELCKKAGIGFLCSPFGLKSLQELLELTPDRIKIASPELNHFPLLRAAAASGLPLILSTGVSKLCDIERALDETKEAHERTLLHCVTSYPAPENEYNLRILDNLAAIFGIKVGISDHSMDPVLVPLLGAACGACMVEKHICLTRNDPGLDDPVALPPDQFAHMAHELRRAVGKYPEDVISEMKTLYGHETVEAVLGNGIKSLAPAEEAHYGKTNRSLHYMRDMDKGEIIGEKDCAILRTEKILSPGIGPEFSRIVTGKRLVRRVENGAGISWDDLLR